MTRAGWTWAALAVVGVVGLVAGLGYDERARQGEPGLLGRAVIGDRPVPRGSAPTLIDIGQYEKLGANTLTVESGGIAGGPYRRAGVHAGRPCYQGPGGWRIYWTGAAWEIASGLPPGPEPLYYTTSTRPDGAWEVGEFGSSPVPTVRLGG